MIFSTDLLFKKFIYLLKKKCIYWKIILEASYITMPEHQQNTSSIFSITD